MKNQSHTEMHEVKDSSGNSIDNVDEHTPSDAPDREFRKHLIGQEKVIEELTLKLDQLHRDLNISKTVKDRLKAREKKYRDFFNHLPDIAFYHDLNGKFTETNKAFKHFFYCDKKQSSNITLKQITAENDNSEITAYLDRLQNQGQDAGTVKVILPDDQVRFLSYNTILLKNVKGTPSICGLSRDITDHVLLKHKCHDEELYYRNIFENSGLCIFILEENFMISAVNLKGAQLLAYSKEEIEGKINLFSFFTPEYKNRHLKNGTFTKDFTDKDTFDFETNLIDRHGQEHTMLINTRRIPGTTKIVASAVEISPLKKAEEILYHYQLDLKDRIRKKIKELWNANKFLQQQLHERDVAEDKLRQSELKYRRLFENIGLPTAIVNKDRTIAEVNDIFSRNSGYTKEELEGKKKWSELVSQQDRSKTDDLWDKLKNDPHPKRAIIEVKALKKNGEEADILARVVPFPYTDQIVGSFLDLNRVKALRNSKSHSYNKCLEYIHPDDQQRVKKQIEEALKSKTAFQIEYRIQSRDGDQKWVLQTGQGTFSKSGGLISIEGVLIDAGNHVQDSQALANEKQLVLSKYENSHCFGNIIGKSQSMQAIYQLIFKASRNQNHVIVYGESGTGKELVARAIHDLSDRRDNAFVAVNCGAVAESLIESEFFGYKKGAFTGAFHDKKGYFAEANGGTIFLDEIGEISVNMQIKLLRVIEGGGYTPVGTSHINYSDVRVIGATNQNLWEMVNQGKMREDFYYRIHILPIHLPPLRERMEDLPLLMEHFLKSYGDINIDEIPGHIMERFKSHHWPGNIRELQNVLFRYITLGTIDFSPHIYPSFESTADILGDHQTYNLREIIANVEKRILYARLTENNWNKSKTAMELGLDRKTLLKKIKTYGLSE